jgi:hypothetical protein
MEGVCKVIGVAGLLKEKYVRTRPQFVTPWTHESLFSSKGTSFLLTICTTRKGK